jgi:hypothetical protein
VRRQRFFVDLVYAEQDNEALSRFVDGIEPQLERPAR